jgi:hypothetical protein
MFLIGQPGVLSPVDSPGIAVDPASLGCVRNPGSGLAKRRRGVSHHYDDETTKLSEEQNELVHFSFRSEWSASRRDETVAYKIQLYEKVPNHCTKNKPF